MFVTTFIPTPYEIVPGYFMMTNLDSCGEPIDPTECMNTAEYLDALNAIDNGDKSVGWRA